MTRSTVKYLALLALAITLFYWKTVLTDQFTILIGSEGVNQSYAWLHFQVDSIWRGHLPLWDPYAWGGRPFAVEMQPAAYYPPRLLFALVPLNRNGMISPRFFHEFMALTHLFCAYFMFALLRDFRCSRFASFIGAIAFALGGLISRMMWPMSVESCIWLPAVFLFLLRALRAATRGRALIEAALSGLCLGMSILTGRIDFSMMQGIFGVTAVLYYGWISQPDGAIDRRLYRTKMALILVIFLVVAGGMGAIQLLPEREYSQLALRFIDGGSFPAGEKIPYHRLVPGMWPQSIVSGLFPNAFDGRIGGEEYFPYYIGVLPFFLALVAIWRGWSRPWVRYLTAMAVLAFIYALGEFSPLHGMLYAVVPFLWVARASNRFFYLISFALAVLAAFGLDTLLQNPARDWWSPVRAILKWLAIACAGTLFLSGLFPQLNLGSWNALSLLVVLTACGCFARMTVQPAGPLLRFALAAFILFDLSAFAWLELDKSSPGKPAAQLDQMISLRGPAAFIKSRPGLHRVRVQADPEPNIGDVFQVQGVWGGGATILKSYARLGVREELLNVRYRIRPASTPDPNPVYSDANWKVYENPAAFPRAWLVHRTVVESSQDAVFRRLDDSSIDLHKTAVLDTPLAQPLGDPAGVAESVRFLSYEPDRMAIEVNAAKPGLLVLSEFHYPGWHATVNGKRTPIYKVDGALRGISTPGGASRIELDYSPASFFIGGSLTLLTLLCVLAAVIVSWRKGLWSPLSHDPREV
jgi:hypothetical protein